MVCSDETVRKAGNKVTQEQMKSLVADMSLEEKIGQLLQVTSGFFAEKDMITGPIRENGITEDNLKLTGSVIGLLGAKEYKRVQKEFMEKHPHHIPLLFMLDVINGFRTVFPIPLGQGAAFEPELSRRCAQVAAKEASVSGIHITFAPMADLVRDARWGRVMESTGEDPLLNADYAKAMVEGFQGENVGEAFRVGACVKHFAGYGAPVAGRDYNTVELSENTLREYYLPAYEAAVKAGSELVMTSFNTLGGIPSTGNRRLMRDILRGEMGFDGVLISDWAAIEELIYHGYAQDKKEAARLSIEAGVDIDMMTGIYNKELAALIKEGRVREELLDEAVYRILKLKDKLGLFEHPWKDADEELEKKVILCEDHRRLALEAAEKSFVLLKNDGILPLQKEEKVAFIGPFVREKELCGAWSMVGRAEDTLSIEEAAIKLGAGEEWRFARGSMMLGEEERLLTPAPVEEILSQEKQEELLTEAAELAAWADKVVLAIGEHRLMSGEAASRGEIRIPEVQKKLFDAVRKANPNVAVVLFTGRPLDIREIAAGAKAVLNVWMPGTEGGRAIVRTLTGENNPSGKLPMSFPYCVGQLPVSYNEYFTGRPFSGNAEERAYRSSYRDIPNEPLYPFGYGLGYANFAFTDRYVSSRTLSADGAIEAGVTVENTGDREGTETVQLYIRDCYGSVVRPKKELKAYRKISLKPGERRKVTFTITEKMLAFTRADLSYGSEPGTFLAFIGADSRVEEGMEFALVE